MKLEKIKRSGFRLFIDAIHWVMGKRSAKYLRDASMADIIFTGSVTHKPVSIASVELVFDNSEDKVGQISLFRINRTESLKT